MEGNVDDVVGELDATSNALEFVDGIDGDAASFDGNESVTFESSPFGICEFTISGWLRTSAQGRPGIFHLRTGVGDDYRNGGLSPYLAGGRLTFESEDLIGQTRFAADVPVNDREFHHFALTVRPNDRLEWFIDGNPVPAAAHTEVANFQFLGLDRGAIGQRYFDGIANNQFRGDLDDLRIVRRALGLSEIQSLIAGTSSFALMSSSESGQQPFSISTREDEWRLW